LLLQFPFLDKVWHYYHLSQRELPDLDKGDGATLYDFPYSAFLKNLLSLSIAFSSGIFFGKFFSSDFSNPTRIIAYGISVVMEGLSWKYGGQLSL